MNIAFIPKVVDDDDVRLMIDGDPFGVDEWRQAEQSSDVLLEIMFVDGEYYDKSLKDEGTQSPIHFNKRSFRFRVSDHPACDVVIIRFRRLVEIARRSSP